MKNIQQLINIIQNGYLPQHYQHAQPLIRQAMEYGLIDHHNYGQVQECCKQKEWEIINGHKQPSPYRIQKQDGIHTHSITRMHQIIQSCTKPQHLEGAVNTIDNAINLGIVNASDYRRIQEHLQRRKQELENSKTP